MNTKTTIQEEASAVEDQEESVEEEELVEPEEEAEEEEQIPEPVPAKAAPKKKKQRKD